MHAVQGASAFPGCETWMCLIILEKG